MENKLYTIQDMNTYHVYRGYVDVPRDNPIFYGLIRQKPMDKLEIGEGTPARPISPGDKKNTLYILRTR